MMYSYYLILVIAQIKHPLTVETSLLEIDPMCS
jgi:hypothetical protein